MPLPIASVSTFADGLDHPECIAVHPDGSVWAGGEAGQIYRIAPDGASFEQVASTGGFVLGLAFEPDARGLIVCDLRNHCLWRLDLESRRLDRFSDGPADGEPFSIPNFPVFAPDGTLYVSDSGAFRQVNGRIIRFAPGSDRGELWHAGPFDFANGLALAPDGSALFVVCSFLPGVERLEIRPDGSPGARSVFAEMPETVPDGLAFDAEGHLFISCYAPNRIYRAAPDGSLDVFVDDWEAHTICNPTNIAFGGEHFDRLFAANLGRWHVAVMDAGVRGAPLACHR